MTATLRCEIFPADLDAIADFYVRVLGFVLQRDDRGAAEGHLELRRGRVQLGAAARPEVDVAHGRPPPGVELVLEVDDLDEERARVAAAGWPVEQDVVLRPWGLRDFRLLDPSGNMLRITTAGAVPARGARDPRASRIGAAYAGIAVGALAVVGATAVALRWAARPPAGTTVRLGPGTFTLVR